MDTLLGERNHPPTLLVIEEVCAAMRQMLSPMKKLVITIAIPSLHKMKDHDEKCLEAAGEESQFSLLQRIITEVRTGIQKYLT